jgi:hypothetical protein
MTKRIKQWDREGDDIRPCFTADRQKVKCSPSIRGPVIGLAARQSLLNLVIVWAGPGRIMLWLQ